MGNVSPVPFPTSPWRGSPWRGGLQNCRWGRSDIDLFSFASEIVLPRFWAKLVAQDDNCIKVKIGSVGYGNDVLFWFVATPHTLLIRALSFCLSLGEDPTVPVFFWSRLFRGRLMLQWSACGEESVKVTHYLIESKLKHVPDINSLTCHFYIKCKNTHIIKIQSELSRTFKLSLVSVPRTFQTCQKSSA